jgi:hypothetical protein
MSSAELIIDTASNLAAVTKGEIDSQIATAKEYPRNIAKCRAEIREMACSDPDIAAQMFYAVPRAGKTIEGPSVRLAEVVAYSWTNIRFESRIVGSDDSFVTAQATVMDMERNTAGRGECKRRITTKDGKKYGDDMIQTTCNAACAIALREAIFRVVPRVMFESVWKEAKLISVGEIKSVIGAASKALAWFSKSGVTGDRVLAAIGRELLADVTEDDLGTLRGITQALREGTTTLEEAFPMLAVDTSFIDKPLRVEDPADAMASNEDSAYCDFSDCRTIGVVNDREKHYLESCKTDGQAELVSHKAEEQKKVIRARRGPRTNKADEIKHGHDSNIRMTRPQPPTEDVEAKTEAELFEEQQSLDGEAEPGELFDMDEQTAAADV